MIVAPRSHSERPYRSRTGLLVLIACMIVLAAWAMAFLSGNDFRVALMAVSPRAVAIVTGSGALTISIIIGSLLATAVAVLVFTRFRTWFWVLLISAFALSEIQVNVLNYFGFVVRYSFICVIIASGVTASLFGESLPGKTDRMLGLAYLAWLLILGIVHGVSGASAAMLPMQVALMLGVLWGLAQEFRNVEDVRWLCAILGRLGAVFTLLHLSALVLSPEPFVNGRFRSYFFLPTNFANRYALLYIAMIWAAITDRTGLRRLLLWGCVLAGGGLLLLSGTRTAVMMVAIALCVFGLAWNIRLPVLIAVVASLVLVAVASLMRDASRFEAAAARISDFDASNRYDVWASAWRLIEKQPWFGYGLGRTEALMTQGMQWWAKATYIDAHNAYMGLWLQLGLFGLLLVLVLYARAIHRGFVMLFLKGRSLSRPLREAAALPLAILCAMFAGGFFEENLTSRGSLPQLLWGVSIVLIAVLSEISIRANVSRMSAFR